LVPRDHRPGGRTGRTGGPLPVTPAFEDLTEAEQYAINHPGRAASIRAEGGLPARCNFGPPEPALVAALVAGTSPTLRALDKPAHAAAA
jgi:hypothetical protein